MKYEIQRISSGNPYDGETHCVGENGVTKILDCSTRQGEGKIVTRYNVYVGERLSFQWTDVPVKVEFKKEG